METLFGARHSHAVLQSAKMNRGTEMAGKITKPQRTCIGCLVIVFVALGILFGFVRPRMQERSRQEWAKAQAVRRQEWVDRVKSGWTHVNISDPELLRQLATDDECVRNVAELHFGMVDIPPEAAVHVALFANVKSIGFYSTQGADLVLSHARHLPIETLHFEVTHVSDESLRNLSEFAHLKEIYFSNELKSLDEILLRLDRPNESSKYPTSK